MAKEISSLRPIMISGYFGFGNCGDEAILMSMIQEFSKSTHKDKIVVLSQDPKKTKQLYQVDAVYRLNPILIISRMKKSSVFISGGGGLLQDASGKGFSIFYYLSLLFLASLFNIPSIVYGQGIGPVQSNINKKLIKWVLKRVNIIMVRDKQSKIFLGKLGVKKNKQIIVNADTAFLLKGKEVPKTIKDKYRLEHSQGTAFKRMNIAMVIRNCKEIGMDYESKIIKYAEISDHLIEKYQANLFLIPFQVQTDLPLMKDIIKKMSFSTVKCIEEELRPDEILSLISNFSLIIGMRLHSIIFATITNRPFIAIDYDPKVKYYVDSLDLPELLINLNQLTVKNLDNKLKYIQANREMIQSKLKLKKEQFEQEAFSNVQLFYQFIAKKCLRKELTNN